MKHRELLNQEAKAALLKAQIAELTLSIFDALSSAGLDSEAAWDIVISSKLDIPKKCRAGRWELSDSIHAQCLTLVREIRAKQSKIYELEVA